MMADTDLFFKLLPMKKLSVRQKRHQLRRRAKIEARRRASKRIRKNARQQEPLDDRVSRRNPARKRLTPYVARRPRQLALPQTLSLTSDYEETVEFFAEFRKLASAFGKTFSIDFTTLKYVSPAAALILAAEVDRWRVLVGLRLRVLDEKLWKPQVLRLLHEKGLFDLLQIANPPRVRERSVYSTRFIRFRAGNITEGAFAGKLRRDIEKETGSIPRPKLLYGGLIEAMTNVAHHAYPDDADYTTRPAMRQWWMSGSVVRGDTGNKLSVIFFDQGVGIPKTLPRNKKWEQLKGILSRLGLDDDANRIKAAMELGRTRTEQRHRGRGLSQFLDFVNDVDDGTLRILSNSGEYIIRSNGEERLSRHPVSIGGTLIQWDIVF